MITIRSSNAIDQMPFVFSIQYEQLLGTLYECLPKLVNIISISTVSLITDKYRIKIKKKKKKKNL